ncbi:MAG: hypothetical protein JW715_00380, partial [Sedimentisphaerales bacterium]|nr:hypothetical protein [Sedimentisphaerales bacterium]
MQRYIRNFLIGTILFSILAPFDFCNTAEAAKTLVINELMASNKSAAQDEQGQYDDWIEIYNYGTNAIYMGGMYLTDDL